MDINCFSIWHVGGTRTPFLVKQARSPVGIATRRAANGVPLRATERVLTGLNTQVKRVFCVVSKPNGTEWHDRPPRSAHGRRRAR